MTIKIRGQVIRLQHRITDPWASRAVLSGGPIDGLHTGTQYSASWPEAMQQAHLAIRDLDRELMAEVHAERAARRATPRLCPSCELAAPTLGHDPSSHGCNYHRPDAHTSEASC